VPTLREFAGMLAVALGSARKLETHYSESVAFELRAALRSPFIRSPCSDLLTPEQEAAYEEVVNACGALYCRHRDGLWPTRRWHGRP
jgi:hypothetical protein